MLDQIFNNPDFSNAQIIIYFLGAFGWFISYMLVIRKIRLEKWVEFPAWAIAGNVGWEFLWGFVFELSFGGIFLQYLWRGGLLLDIYMLYAVYKYGKSQYNMEFIKKNFHLLVTGVLVSMTLLIYFFVEHGYDLEMGFNSGMILNLIHSIGCLMLFYEHPKRQFSAWIGISRFFGSSIFFFIYMLMYTPVQYFSITMLSITFIIDLYYIVQVIKRNKTIVIPA